MKKECIELHFPKYIKSSIIVVIVLLFNFFLFHYLNEVINPIYIYLISFIGESLAIIPYFIEKKRTKIEYHFNLKKKQIIFIFLFICSICDFIGKIDFRVFFYNNINKSKMINDIINVVCLFFFIFLVEHIILRIPIYRHHIFGIGLSIVGMLIVLIVNFNITIKNMLVLFVIFLFSLTTRYLISLNYVIPKKLNTEYFIDMNLICFIRGIIGIFISIIFIIINIYFPINQLTNNNNNEIVKIDYILMVIYCIISFILNIYILKVTEESRPCYILIPEFSSQIILILLFPIFSYLFSSIVQVISYIMNQSLRNSKNKTKNSHNSNDTSDKIIEIISNLFSFIGVLFFSEIITISLFNLNKFTKSAILERSDLDSVIALKIIKKRS